MTINVHKKLKTLASTAMFVVLLVGFNACSFSGTTVESPRYKKGLVQATTYGQVKGVEANKGRALIWKGVPYAKVPEGKLRWRAPEDPESWKGVLDATKGGDTGIQFTRRGKLLGSENCLNLDIYRPNSDEINLPVLIYIHGGNNQSGSAAEMNAQHLAVKARAVIVSINYRLGLLGFNNLPALRTGDPSEDSGNYAILDIAKSLDWAKNNIASFGGDPNNLTISGFSAGGRDVMALLISPIVAGKFHKAISLSGGMTLANYNASTRVIAKAVAPLVVEDKVKSDEKDAYEWLLTDTPQVKEYLYGLAADRLAKLMTNAGIRMAVFPHLYNDGMVLPETGFHTRNYNDVPLIMVTSSQEFSIFARFDKKFARVKNERLLSDNEISHSYQFAKKYGSQLYGLFNAQESAEKMFDHYEAPIYTCSFNWGTDPHIVGEKMSLFGAFHGVWLPFLTHEASGFSGMFHKSFDSAGAKELADRFTNYIANFLWNGNPNGGDLLEWKAWSNGTTGPKQLLLDADKDRAVVSMSSERTIYEDVLKEIEADTSISRKEKAILIKQVLNGRWFSHKLDKKFNGLNRWIGID